jgi:hypothetical protein
MSITVAPQKSALFTKLRTFLLTIVPAGTEVVQGLGNRVTLPAGPFVCMTGIFQDRLATNEDSYDDPYPTPGGVQNAKQSTRLDVQLDCYGPDSLAWATVIETLFRDEVGCVALAPDLQPLYTDSPRMVPLITGEEQFLERWTVTAVLQYNPVTVTAQDFADTLAVTLINVDEAYPP